MVNEHKQRMREQYARGYEDGRRSMDAEHYAVAIRLQDLTFDGGSHENLRKIAYTIYPCATDWTCESSEGLRDELVRLMSGVGKPSGSFAKSAETAKSDADDGGEVRRITDELRKWTGINVWSSKWEEFNAIADRIDEQFARICWQQEAVLQQTIDEQDGRITKLVRQRDELQTKLDAIREALDGS